MMEQMHHILSSTSTKEHTLFADNAKPGCPLWSISINHDQFHSPSKQKPNLLVHLRLRNKMDNRKNGVCWVMSEKGFAREHSRIIRLNPISVFEESCMVRKHSVIEYLLIIQVLTQIQIHETIFPSLE